MFDPSQEDVRRFFCGTWAKHLAGAPLTPLEAMALDAILAHPEYHDELASLEQALTAQYPVDSGRTNPFLHLSLHLGVAEQCAIDQPSGIRAALAELTRKLDSGHAAAHEVIECLAETIWQAQRSGTAPDSVAYLECLKRRASR